MQPGSNGSSRNFYTTNSPALRDLELTTGQAVLRSPSVFNFFQPTFSPAGPIADLNLTAPEFELMTESNELATSNFIGDQIQVRSTVSNSASFTNAFLDLSPEYTLASDVNALLDHLDTVLLSGNMSAGLRALLETHLQTLEADQAGLLARARDAITLIMASPDYLIQM